MIEIIIQEPTKDTTSSLQSPLSKKTNQIEHVSTEGDIIHIRTRFRGSEYLVWLVITQWIGSTSVDRNAIWFFFYHIFSKIFGEVVSLGFKLL